MKWLLALLLASGCEDRCEQPARSAEDITREWASRLKLTNVAAVCHPDGDLSGCNWICDVTYEQGSYRALSVLRCNVRTGSCYAVR